MKCYNEETTRRFLRTRFSAEERGGREASLTSTACLGVCLGGDNRQQLQQKMSSLGVARRLPAVMASCSTNSHSEGAGAGGARETSSNLAGFQAFGFYSLAPMKAWFPWEKTSCLTVQSAGRASRAQPGL